MKRSVTGLISILLLLLGACTTELKLPEPKGGQKIVLLGELTAGDTMLLRAGQSVPLGTSNDGQLPQLIQGLNITVNDNHGNSIPLRGEEDGLSYMLLTIPFSNPQAAQANTQYELTASHKELGIATAAVNIPPPFSVQLRQRTYFITAGDTMVDLRLEMNDPAPIGHQYVIEVLTQPISVTGYFSFEGSTWPIDQYRDLYDSLVLEGIETFPYYDTAYSGMYSRKYFYCTDQSAENIGGAMTGRLMRRVFLPETALSGGSHQTQLIIPLKSEFEFEVQHAETIVHIKSVAADYYNYLKAYDNYNPSLGGLAGTNVENMTGNVKNGLGMVGGVYRQTIRFVN